MQQSIVNVLSYNLQKYTICWKGGKFTLSKIPLTLQGLLTTIVLTDTQSQKVCYE